MWGITGLMDFEEMTEVHEKIIGYLNGSDNGQILVPTEKREAS